MDKKIIFFAYQGRKQGEADSNVSGIKKAIEIINQHNPNYEAKSWEDNKKTNFINFEILKEIEKCEIFVCDITYFNHNVLFELGYAISKNKKILILLNESIKGAKDKYHTSIFKNLRYSNSIIGKNISTDIQKQQYNDDLLNTYVKVSAVTANETDLFYIQSPVENQDSIDLTEFIKLYQSEKNLSAVIDNSNEVSYKPIQFYFHNIVKSKGVIINLLSKNYENEFDSNGANSFWAGISSGLNKEIKLVAPAQYRAPLDYHDILYQYNSGNDLIDDVEIFLNDLISSKNNVTNQDQKIVPSDHEFNLIKLGVGDVTAEGEDSKLNKYFVETSVYHTAQKKTKAIIAGEKGSGKTALYYKLKSDFEESNDNFIINIMPDPDELEEQIHLSEYFTKTSVKSFYYTVWTVIIYNKLLSIIVTRLTNCNRSEEEDVLEKFFNDNNDLIKLSFRGVAKHFSKQTKNKDTDYLETIHKEYLSRLKTILRNYIVSSKHNYYKIIILSDNLDRTWDLHHGLNNQIEMINALLDIDTKIARDLNIDGKTKISIKNIVFLRTDILDFMQQQLGEKDKLRAMSRHTIDWKKHTDLLRSVIENRFKYFLELESDEDIKKVWEKYFKFSSSKEPFELILDIAVNKPRDLIYFITRLFESTIDNRHTQALDDDFNNAAEEYLLFVEDYIQIELAAKYPEIFDVFEKLKNKKGLLISLNSLFAYLKKSGLKKQKYLLLLQDLYNKEYITFFSDAKELEYDNFLNIYRSMTFFKSYRIEVAINCKSYRLAHIFKASKNI